MPGCLARLARNAADLRAKYPYASTNLMKERDLRRPTTDDRRPGAAHHSQFGAAHTRPRDAYHDVPILKEPTWNNEVAAYFFFGGVSAGAALVGSLADVVGGERHKRLARVAHYVSFATLLPCPPLL